jgi:hypothetical protein
LRATPLRWAFTSNIPVRDTFAGSFLRGLFLFAHGDFHFRANRISDAKECRLAYSFLPVHFNAEGRLQRQVATKSTAAS